MKKLAGFVTFLILFFLLFNSTCFSAGLPFYKAKPLERQNLNEVLSNLIQKSLELDPNGNKPLFDGHITPKMFLEVIQKNYPSSKLEAVEELPQYLRSLEKRPAPQDGEHRLVRIVKDSKGVRLDSVGWQRKFYLDEFVWFDINTGEDILSGYCANVIVPEPKPEILPELIPPIPFAKQSVQGKPEFEFCSEYVAELGEIPIAPFSVCSATEFVELRYPGEMVPIVYGICDAKGRPVYSSKVEITFEDYSENGANLVQKNEGIKLVRGQGCTQVMIKRGFDYKTLKPFDSETTNGGRSSIIFSAQGVDDETIVPLSIPWEVDVKNIPRGEEISLNVNQTDVGVIANVSVPSENFVTGFFSLIKKEGRRDRVIYRTNPREDGSFNFGKLPEGKYLVAFFEGVLVEDKIYLREKAVKEIEVK
ncbi:hypothetical protein KKG48_00675 [Patescibacteria group bacterium]|nr:hypothetical protein [Patescibacteria group bacterium]MCG2695247.1 hypothetical protein [Candidatus Parcubacteria bacterium]